MSLVCRAYRLAVVCLGLGLAFASHPAMALDGDSKTSRNIANNIAVASVSPDEFASVSSQPSLPEIGASEIPGELQMKMAYGRTFGTCTSLDYATVEVSTPLKKFPGVMSAGRIVGEIQMAVLGSYVFYSGGAVERLKRLDFRDGYEVGGIPKGRFTFSFGPMGMATYVESGAGMSYVSETYRNSGSRFNWSLLGGMGFEKSVAGRVSFSMGLQWRHLSNGNMWGKGDELHNSNSGTDMVQGMAAFLKRF